MFRNLTVCISSDTSADILITLFKELEKRLKGFNVEETCFYSYLLLKVSWPRNITVKPRQEDRLKHQDNCEISRWNIEIVLNNPSEMFGLVRLLFKSSWLSFICFVFCGEKRSYNCSFCSRMLSASTHSCFTVQRKRENTQEIKLKIDLTNSLDIVIILWIQYFYSINLSWYFLLVHRLYIYLGVFVCSGVRQIESQTSMSERRQWLIVLRRLLIISRIQLIKTRF